MPPEGDDKAFLWDMREAASDISKTVLEMTAPEFAEAKFTRLALDDSPTSSSCSDSVATQHSLHRLDERRPS